MLLPLARSVANYESHIQTITNSVVLLTSRLTIIEQIVNTFSTKMAAFAEMEQNVSSLTPRICKIEASAASASSGSGSVSSWNLLGHSDGSTATGSIFSHPMAQGLLTTTETQDVDLILSLALKMNMHEVPSYCSFRANNTTLVFPCGSIVSGKSPTYQPTTNPSGFIAKQVVYPPDSYSRRELNVRTLWLDARMMVSAKKLTVHFATTEPISQSVSPSHLKTEKSEDDSRLYGKFCPQSHDTSSQKEMIQVPSLSLH